MANATDSDSVVDLDVLVCFALIQATGIQVLGPTIVNQAPLVLLVLSASLARSASTNSPSSGSSAKSQRNPTSRVVIDLLMYSMSLLSRRSSLRLQVLTFDASFAVALEMSGLASLAAQILHKN